MPDFLIADDAPITERGEYLLARFASARQNVIEILRRHAQLAGREGLVAADADLAGQDAEECCLANHTPSIRSIP